MVAFSDFCLKRFKANINLRYNKKISENISALIELTSEYDFQISHLSQILFRQKIKNQPVCKRWQIYMVLHFLFFSLKWWSWKYSENLPVERVSMGLLFWYNPNHHHGQKPSGRYHLLWHWCTPHWKWETVLSVRLIKTFPHIVPVLE